MTEKQLLILTTLAQRAQANGGSGFTQGSTGLGLVKAAPKELNLASVFGELAALEKQGYVTSEDQAQPPRVWFYITSHGQGRVNELTSGGAQ